MGEGQGRRGPSRPSLRRSGHRKDSARGGAEAARPGAAFGVQRISMLTRAPQHALYPVVEFLQRLMRFHECGSPVEKLARLEASLTGYEFCGPEVVSLMANLLSLPVGEKYPSLMGSPALQKRRTLESLVAWLCERAAEQPILCICEDLHWADPSTLELLGLLIERLPIVSIMAVFTFRSTFTPPWPKRSYVTAVEVNR